ncbi:MAG TPA: hypothetical protein VD967_02275, partial [Candidatus Paceibacterota bacterium]|nr:hypothetical protein [Candidatus Paceibacterota bacterium]
MKKILLALILCLALFAGFVALAQDDDGGGGFTSSGVTNNNDCTGGQCGAEVDQCSASGAQCYSPQYCTEYNTPRFSSPLRISVPAGAAMSYEVMVAQVNPNPSRDLAPWEHPLIHERNGETGWYGVNVTSLDAAGLGGSGLSANTGSVTVFKRTGVPQVPDSTGLVISGVPTAPGTYFVPLNSRNDLKEWLYHSGMGGGDGTGGESQEYVGRSASCSRADILEIQVTEAVQCTPQAPVITSAGSVTGQVGEPFSYTATATGHTSLSMTCDDISGVNWNGSLRIAGTPSVAGTYACSIEARNDRPSCAPQSASKNVTIVISAADECAAATPEITSATSVSGEIGAPFAGYTIQTSPSRPADRYAIFAASGDTLPESLAVVNNGRSLEGSIAASQPKRQYNFVVRAVKNVSATTSCPAQQNVILGLNCPSARPNWNPENGQCTDQPVAPRCTDPTAVNY